MSNAKPIFDELLEEPDANPIERSATVTSALRVEYADFTPPHISGAISRLVGAIK